MIIKINTYTAVAKSYKHKRKIITASCNLFLTLFSPDEFLMYVVDTLKQGIADQHWRPQHGECPLCLFNFTIYGKVEEIFEDTAYFALKVLM